MVLICAFGLNLFVVGELLWDFCFVYLLFCVTFVVLGWCFVELLDGWFDVNF